MNSLVGAVVVFCAVVAVCSNAAVTSFFWTSGSGEAKNSAGVNLPTGRTLLTYVSSDSVIDWTSSWVDNTDAGRYGARGNDLLLNSFSTTGVGGGKYNTATLRDPSGTYVNYYVYGVLLDLPYGSPVVDQTYYDLMSATKGPLSNRDQTPDPELTAQSFTDGPLQTSSQLSVVPEPTTLALLALGVGAVVCARKRRK